MGGGDAWRRWVKDFFSFFFVKLQKKTHAHPLNAPEPSLGSPVPIREGPIRGGPTQIGLKFSSFGSL
jgi:hypothetical protein